MFNAGLLWPSGPCNREIKTGRGFKCRNKNFSYPNRITLVEVSFVKLHVAVPLESNFDFMHNASNIDAFGIRVN